MWDVPGQCWIGWFKTSSSCPWTGLGYWDDKGLQGRGGAWAGSGDFEWNWSKGLPSESVCSQNSFAVSGQGWDCRFSSESLYSNAHSRGLNPTCWRSILWSTSSVGRAWSGKPCWFSARSFSMTWSQMHSLMHHSFSGTVGMGAWNMLFEVFDRMIHSTKGCEPTSATFYSN